MSIRNKRPLKFGSRAFMMYT